MLEPETIRNTRFSQAKNGFNPTEVIDFLNELANEVEAVLAEKNENEERLKMLFDKVNQYREDEDAIKQAMIYAQKEANKVLKDAKAKARDMIDSAKTEEVRIREQSSAECERIVNEHKEKCAQIIKEQTQGTQDEIARIQDTYEEEKAKLDKLKAEVTYFKSNLIDLYTKQIGLITEMPQMTEEELTEYESTAEAEYYEDDDEYYDENGEYYDDNGEYYDENGGYYDENGNYYDENGGYYDENGNYYDANGEFYEAESEYTEEELAQQAEEERINRALDTTSFEPIIPKVDPSTLQFGNNSGSY